MYSKDVLYLLFIFTFSLEPLATEVREEPKILGIWIEAVQYKIGFYEDDIVIFLTDIEKPNKVLENLITQYGTVSRYTLNIDKSEIISLNTNLN